MTGLAFDMDRCEWSIDGASAPGGDDEECPNVATWSLGADGEWHVCDRCAELPALKRFRKRVHIGERMGTYSEPAR